MAPPQIGHGGGSALSPSSNGDRRRCCCDCDDDALPLFEDCEPPPLGEGARRLAGDGLEAPVDMEKERDKSAAAAAAAASRVIGERHVVEFFSPLFSLPDRFLSSFFIISLERERK